jgi:hypothetical protein
MGDLTGIFVVGFIVLGIYKVTELFAKRKERLAIIEKLTALEADKGLLASIHLPEISFGKPNSGFGVLKLSLLLIGVGVGCISAFFVQLALVDLDSLFVADNRNYWVTQQIQTILNFSFITVFGGLGLLVAYLIETKQRNKKQ